MCSSKHSSIVLEELLALPCMRTITWRITLQHGTGMIDNRTFRLSTLLIRMEGASKQVCEDLDMHRSTIMLCSS